MRPRALKTCVFIEIACRQVFTAAAASKHIDFRRVLVKNRQPGGLTGRVGRRLQASNPGGGSKGRMRSSHCHSHSQTLTTRHRQLNTSEPIWNPNPPAMPLRRCHTFLAMIDVLGRSSAVASRGTGVVRFPLSILTHCMISVHPCASCLSLGRIRPCSCRGRFVALLRRPAALHTR
jgi:hypothetical protein